MENQQPTTDYMKAVLNKKRKHDELIELKRMPGVVVIDGSEFILEIEKIRGILNAIIKATGDKPLSNEDFLTLMKNINEKKNE